MNIKNAISVQDGAVDEILAAPTQGRRAAAYGFTVLNRKYRSLGGIRSRMSRQLTGMGYTDAQTARAWADVIEMAKLKAMAEDE
jgi:hypothetical protein